MISDDLIERLWKVNDRCGAIPRPQSNGLCTACEVTFVYTVEHGL